MSITMMSPTWYDLLDLEPSATTDEIRAAWKAGIADLDPTDRRFRTLNEAAAVLLDADKRKAYDAELAEQEALLADEETDEETDAEAEDEESGEPEARSAVDLDKRSADDAEADAVDDSDTAVVGADDADEADEETDADEAARPRRTIAAPPRWALAAVAVLAIAALVAALVVLVRGGTKVETAANRNATTSTLEANYGAAITHDHTTLLESQAEDALAAAKTAVVPVLSYDYRHMAADEQKAHSYITASYRKDYDEVFGQVKANAPAAKAVVKVLPPLDAGIVRVSSDRVQVLLFVDRPTTNLKTTKPIPYQDYVTLTMVKQGGKWLVDAITTQPASS